MKMDFLHLKNFFEWPVPYQFLGFMLLISALLYVWYGTNLKKDVNFEVRSTSTKEKLAIQLQLTGPKGNIVDVFSENGKFSAKCYYGEHKVKSITPDYELNDEFFKVNRYTENTITLWLKRTAFRNKEDTSTTKIQFTGTQIEQTSTNEVVLFTTITSTTKRLSKKPLKQLTEGNFTIEEQYRGILRNASILNVLPIAKPFRIIVVVDISGSMKQNIQKVEKALLTLFDIIGTRHVKSATDSVAVLLVTGKNAERQNFLENSGNIWFPINTNGRDILSTVLNNVLKPGGNTPLWDSILLSLDELKNLSNAYRLIVILSDGMNTSGNRDFSYLKEETIQAGIPIFTIGYKGTRGLAQESLETLASISLAGGPGVGSFMEIDLNELNESFASFGNSVINSYQIAWKPTGASIGDEVKVKIKVLYEGHQRIFTDDIERKYIFSGMSQKI